jgi:2-polyprenyl-6-methoxyphenol hydroxylase-like FAD-dependent oxidoreductase
MTDTNLKDFDVSIVGGGIGGVVAAVGLLRAGISVNLFEAAVS